MLNVQFSDSTEKIIIGYFSSPQDSAVWPNMGTVEVTDARWKAYYDAQPETSQQYLPAPQ
jgi:hypothetical protein